MDIKIGGYPTQMGFLKSAAPEAAFVAGIGSGKTHIATLKMLDLQIKYPGASAIVTAPSYRIMEMATLPKYAELYPSELVKNHKNRPYPVWELITGGFIYFYSTDNPESIVGGEVSFVHMDEASLSPYLAYVNCKKRMRQRDKDGTGYPYQIWVSTTPRQLNWVYLEFAEPSKGHELFTASTRDNIYRNEVEIEDYINKLGLSEAETAQEIEGKFELLAGDCLFQKADIDRQFTNCLDPESEVLWHKGKAVGSYNVWKDGVVGVKYIAGADCYDEGGGGANCMVIVDPNTGDEMAEVYGNMPADNFAEACFDALGQYNSPQFAPERNGTVGGIVLQKMRDLGYTNLYKDDKGRDGWYTSATAIPPKVDRLNMLKEYEEAVRLRSAIVRSSDALGEMSTFVRGKTGKYKHLPGRLDDRIMARAICWQLRKNKQSPHGFRSWKRKGGTY